MSAGFTSQQPVPPAEPPASSASDAISQNVPPTADMISGTTQVPKQVAPGAINVTKSPACPKLDSQLNQVVTSSDPIQMATSLNLRLKEDKVQVRLILASDDVSFLNEFGVEPGSRAGQELQAFVPIGRLCEISNLEEVLAIRIPAEGVSP